MDVVELSLPLSTLHVATARVVAASLAADAGFTVDEIDDVRLGINEAVAILTDVETTDDARLELEFRVGPQRLEVAVRRTGASGEVEIDELAHRILSTVLDEHSLVEGRFHLAKTSAGTSVGAHDA